MKKRLLIRLCLIGLLVPLWIFLRHVYRDRISAFGCFDDCFNYMGGYFLLSGKRLFSEIFFNHQPLLAYISALIQYITEPNGIYLLIYQHRMFIIYFSIIADIILTLRFGFVGFGFAVLYESTKGYLFGEHFLAESLIVYPLVYLLGLCCHSRPATKCGINSGGNPSTVNSTRPWTPASRGVTSNFDLLLSAVFAWFVVFSREPYIPLVLFLFGYIIWKNWRTFWTKAAIGIFVILSAITIGVHSMRDYFFNVITVNQSRVVEGDIFSAIFYPIIVFFKGTWNLFHRVEASLVGLFWILVIFTIIKRRLVWPIMFLFAVLILANIRVNEPGKIYYAAFHHLQWYAVIIMSTLTLLNGLWHKHRAPAALIGMGFVIITVYAILSPESYLHEKIDRHAEFITNFDVIFVNGGIVKILSGPGDSLFLDGWDDLIYFEAQRHSPYKYSWLTSAMPQFEKFRRARDEMFAKTPPTFFYGRCANGVLSDATIRTRELKEYIQLSPSCVFVHPSKLSKITEGQWKQAEEKFGIIKPTNVKTL